MSFDGPQAVNIVDVNDPPQLLRRMPPKRRSFGRSSPGPDAEPAGQRGMQLQFQNIKYSVPVKGKEPKQILSDLSGTVDRTNFLAVMGPTGSGKTSLLNILAGRLIDSKGAVLEGRVLVDGIPRNTAARRAQFARRVAYVQQDDNMMAFATVEETLEDAALLTLPSTLSREEKLNRVQSLIRQLGLRKAANTIIGMSDGPVRGVSGGERKRVAIAVELLSDPDCLFCDEPTSGLDSFQALNVVQTLKSLVSTGRTVVCSIHQPRSSIYNEFDRLCLLSEGRMVYQGLAGEHAVEYFKRAGFVCPAHFNPADFFMDTCSMDTRSDTQEEASSGRLQRLWGLHEQEQPSSSLNGASKGARSKGKAGASSSSFSPSSPLPMAALEDGLGGAYGSSNGKSNGYYSSRGAGKLEYQASWFTQFLILLRRSWRNVSRNRIGLIIRLVVNVVLSCILAGLYSETGNNQPSIQNRQGILFFMLLNQSFGGMFGAIQTFGKEKSIIVRERFSKAYHVSAYYLARFWTNMPGDILFPSIAGVIVYFAVGLNNEPDRFLIFLVTIAFVAFCAQAVGLLISAFITDFEVATAIAPPILIVMMLFGGFYLNDETLPEGARWVKYLTMHYWGFGILIRNEFDGVTIGCENLPTIQTTTGIAQAVCIRTGGEVIERLGFSSFSMRDGFLGIMSITLGFHLLAYLAIRSSKPRLLHLPAQG